LEIVIPGAAIRINPETRRIHLETRLLTRLGQYLEEILPIHIIPENLLPPITAIQHMINRALCANITN
jgi:hypothetical protein